MARVCTVCSHADRQAIDAALVAGTPNRRVATQHGLTEAGMRRHRKHVADKVAKVERREAETLVGHIAEQRAIVREVITAVRGNDHELALKAVDRLAKLTELEFGTKSKVETTHRPALVLTVGEELAELEKLRRDINEREREIRAAGKGA